MLETIIFVLLILWLFGIFSSIGGGFIHLLLVIAAVIIIIRLIKERNL